MTETIVLSHPTVEEAAKSPLSYEIMSSELGYTLSHPDCTCSLCISSGDFFYLLAKMEEARRRL